ncbi:MAG: PGPGW domain-containing protein [bacterium]
MQRALRQVRRLLVAVVGGTVVLIGLAMVVLPGPATVVIPAGMAILATEFLWARRVLEKTRQRFMATVKKVRRGGENGVEAQRERGGVFCQVGVREEKEAGRAEACQAGRG